MIYFDHPCLSSSWSVKHWKNFSLISLKRSAFPCSSYFSLIGSIPNSTCSIVYMTSASNFSERILASQTIRILYSRTVPIWESEYLHSGCRSFIFFGDWSWSYRRWWNCRSRGCPWTGQIQWGRRTKGGRFGRRCDWRLANLSNRLFFPMSYPAPLPAIPPRWLSRSPVSPVGSQHILSVPPPSLSSEFLYKQCFTQKFNQLVLALHWFDLCFIFSFVLFDAGSASILWGPFEEFTVVDWVFGELSTVWFLAVVVEGGVWVVELAAGGIAAFIEVDLPVFLSCLTLCLPLTSRSKLKSSPLRLNSKSSSEPRELLPLGMNIIM